MILLVVVLLVEESTSAIGFKVCFSNRVGFCFSRIEVFYDSKGVFRDLPLLVGYRIVGGANSSSNDTDCLVDGVD